MTRLQVGPLGAATFIEFAALLQAMRDSILKLRGRAVQRLQIHLTCYGRPATAVQWRELSPRAED
jgi:hypothetical protein